MLHLDLKDVIKGNVYIIRYGGKEHFKTNNKNTLKRLIKALKVLNISDYHIYKLTVGKVEEKDV